MVAGSCKSEANIFCYVCIGASVVDVNSYLYFAMLFVISKFSKMERAQKNILFCFYFFYLCHSASPVVLIF